MKRIMAFIAALTVFTGACALADSYVIINSDFDSDGVGTWRNIAAFSTVEYPENSGNNCLSMPGSGQSQIYIQSGSASGAYYGKLIFSGDVYPMTSNLNTQIFFKFYKLSAPASGAAVENSGFPHCIDFNGSNIKVSNNSTVIGSFTVGTKYSYKIVVDSAAQCYRVYLSGELNGVMHPLPETESEEYPGYELVDTYEYSKEYGPVGMAYIYSGKERAYVDNLTVEAPELSYTISDFEAGSRSITFDMDQFINTDTIGNLKVSRIGSETTELKSGEDYQLSWKMAMDNYARAVSPTITLTEPVGADEQILFDFSGVTDTYGRAVGISAALPRNPDTDALNAVYDDMSQSWFTDTAVKAVTVDAPSEIIVSEEASPVRLSYDIECGKNAEGLITQEDGKIIITRPEADDPDAEPESFDAEAKITVTAECGSQPPKSFVRSFKIIRRKLLDEAQERDMPEIAALCDGDSETAWTPEGSGGELTITFSEPAAIGGIWASGEYESIAYEVSENGADFTAVSEYPVLAKALKVKLSGEGARLEELEPVTSQFFMDVIERMNDLMSFEYSENLSGLTSSTYLTFPKQTQKGTPLKWSTDNRNVIDEYGTVTQTTKNETVKITVQALDLKGNIIPSVKREFTATVAAKKTSGGGGGSSSSGGGGGGGSYTAPLSTPVPEQQPEDVPSGGSAVSDTAFNDIDTVPWAEEAILCMAEKNIISGKGGGVFAPNDNITREEFVKLIVSAFDVPMGGTAAFADVPAEAWYAEFVGAAAAAGIIGGISEHEFGVESNITRQDMAVILQRTAEYKGISAADTAVPPELDDINETAEYARAAIEEMLKSGVISGNGTMLYPAHAATRAEAAVMLHRFINNYK